LQTGIFGGEARGNIEIIEERCKMSISSATKSLTENIEASYETRAASISDVAHGTHQLLENFKWEQQERAGALRNELATAERERTQAFAALNERIKDEVATIERDTSQMLADFMQSHKERINALRNELTAVERERTQAFAEFQSRLRRNVDETIENIAADHRQARSHWENLSKTMATKRARD
jgi:leucyl aminopeptidase (aminopeptidase T)